MPLIPILPTSRDVEILIALDRCPLTVSQLLKLSATFRAPFSTERILRARLQTLAERGWLHRRQFALPGRGTMNYYSLAASGFRSLYDEEEALPKRVTRPVAPGQLPHTQALADFLVHTFVAARDAGLCLQDFSPENAHRLQVGQESLYPDSSFSFVLPGGGSLRFFVELDNVSQSVRSARSLESWERKVRFYESFQDSIPKRFRVLAVTTGTEERIRHIVDVAPSLMREPRRSLLYGITLKSYLTADEPLTGSHFLDHRRKRIALIPKYLGTVCPVMQAEPAMLELAGVV